MKYNRDDLKEALKIIAAERYNTIPDENKINHSFSPKFQKWAERLIVYQINTKPKNTTAKRIIKIILIAAIVTTLLVVTALAIPIVKDAVEKYIIRENGDFYDIQIKYTTSSTLSTDDSRETENNDCFESEITPEDQSNNKPIIYVAPLYVPEGFTITSEAKSPFSLLLNYSNSRFEKIFFGQYALPDAEEDFSLLINSEGKIRSTETINGINVDVFESSLTRTIVWTDDNYFYLFRIDKSIPHEEEEKIFASIGLYESLDDQEN